MLNALLMFFAISPNPVYIDYQNGINRLPNPVISEQDKIKIAKTIKLLGDDSFRVRQTATDELIEFRIKALQQLSDAKDHPDLEVRRRVTFIINQYFFDVVNANNVGIWYLPKEYRFKGGEDISKEYYIKAKTIWNDNGLSPKILEADWHDYGVARLAFSLYLLDKIKSSDTDNRVEAGLIITKSLATYEEFIPYLKYLQDHPGIKGVPKGIEDMIVDGKIAEITFVITGVLKKAPTLAEPD